MSFSLPVGLSFCLFVRQTRDPRLNGSIYRNMPFAPYDRAMLDVRYLCGSWASCTSLPKLSREELYRTDESTQTDENRILMSRTKMYFPWNCTGKIRTKGRRVVCGTEICSVSWTKCSFLLTFASKTAGSDVENGVKWTQLKWWLVAVLWVCSLEMSLTTVRVVCDEKSTFPLGKFSHQTARNVQRETRRGKCLTSAATTLWCSAGHLV